MNYRFCFCCGNAAFFVFPLTGAAEKHLVSEKPLNKRFFKETGVVPTGIERSPKIFDFRANGIPVQKRVDFFDALIILSHIPVLFKCFFADSFNIRHAAYLSAQSS